MPATGWLKKFKELVSPPSEGPSLSSLKRTKSSTAAVPEETDDSITALRGEARNAAENTTATRSFSVRPGIASDVALKEPTEPLPRRPSPNGAPSNLEPPAAVRVRRASVHLEHKPSLTPPKKSGPSYDGSLSKASVNHSSSFRRAHDSVCLPIQADSSRLSPGGFPSAVSIQYESQSSICSIISQQHPHMKNLVFVEAPSNIEVESEMWDYSPGGSTQYVPHIAPSNSNRPTYRTAGVPASGAGAGPGAMGAVARRLLDVQGPHGGAGGKGPFRRIHRNASLPLLIDTNPLHHAGLTPVSKQLPVRVLPPQPPVSLIGDPRCPPAPQATSSPSRGSPHSTSRPSTPGKQLSFASTHFQTQPGDEEEHEGHRQGGQGQGGQGGGNGARTSRKKAPRKHRSLKHLLHLEKYDFVTDVNVVEAQEELRRQGGEEEEDEDSEGEPSFAFARAVPVRRGGHTGRHGHESWQQAVVPSPQQRKSEASKHDWEDSNILAVSPALPPSMRRAKWSVSDFKLSKKLHQGYASDVYFGKCRLTSELVVLKVYRLADQCDLQRVQLYREIRVHSRLQHQNIVQFYAAFIEENCVVIVQEYAAGGDLLRYMYKSGGRLTERHAVNLVLQPFLSALLYLHSQGIIHRDIKPENCLLTETKLLKVADFGLAVDLREERANTRAGTLDYMAPEVLRCPTKETPDQFKQEPGAAHYEMGADSWAVGVFAFELVAGGSPFKGEQMIDTARNIISVNITYPALMSDMSRSFVSSCLRKHPGDRPTVVEMLHHPWITMFQRRASVIPLPPGAHRLARMGASMTLESPDLQSSSTHVIQPGEQKSAGGHLESQNSLPSNSPPQKSQQQQQNQQQMLEKDRLKHGSRAL